MKKKKLKLLSVALSCICTLSFLFSGCGGNKQTSKMTKAANTDMMTANLGAEPKTIDPALNNTSEGSTVIYNMFEGLLRIGSDNKPEPGMAEKWEVKDNGKKYIFHLRDGIKWTDNTPITAKDFKYGILRVLDPATGSPYSYHAYCIKNGKAYNSKKTKAEDVGVKVIDDKTLEIDLEHSVPYFLDILSWHLLIPLKEDMVKKNPNTWANDPSTIVSNGPFKLVEWKHNDHMMFEKNPNYWDAANVKLKKLKLTMMTNNNTALTAYKTGDLDLITDIPAAQLPSLLSSGKAKSNAQIGPYMFCVNVNRKPLNDVRVRRALSLAIDRNALVKTVLRGGEKPAVGFIPYGLSDGKNGSDFRENGKKYIEAAPNVTEAKKLLAEAGYPDGKGFPSISILYNTSDVHKSIAESIQAMWKKNLGINIKLTNQEWKVFLTTRAEGEYDIARDGYFSDFFDPGSLFDLWVTGSPNNDAKYSNPKYDELVAQADEEQDTQKRYELYHKAEDILMNDMPIIPLYYYTQNYMVKSNIKGLHLSPLGWVFFRTVTISQ